MIYPQDLGSIASRGRFSIFKNVQKFRKKFNIYATFDLISDSYVELYVFCLKNR